MIWEPDLGKRMQCLERPGIMKIDLAIISGGNRDVPFAVENERRNLFFQLLIVNFGTIDSEIDKFSLSEAAKNKAIITKSS